MITFKQELESIKLSLNTALTALQLLNSATVCLTNDFSAFGTRSTIVASTRDKVVTCESVEASTGMDIVETRIPGSAHANTSKVDQQFSCNRCPCQCHSSWQGSTPRWLSSLVGTGSYSFTGFSQMMRQPCNSMRC